MQSEYIFPSRTRPGIIHTVRQDSFGNWFCSCEAGEHGVECWHLRKVKGELFIEKLYQAKSKLGSSINFAGIIADQWEYIDQHNMRRHW